MKKKEVIKENKDAFFEAKEFVKSNAEALSEIAHQVTQDLTKSGTFFSKQNFEIAFDSALKCADPEKTSVVLDLPKDKKVQGFIQSQCVDAALEHSPSREFETGVLYSSNELLQAEQKIIEMASKMSVKEGCENQPFQSEETLQNAMAFFKEYMAFSYAPKGKSSTTDEHFSLLSDALKPGNLKIITGPPGSGKSALAQGIYAAFYKEAVDSNRAMPAFYATAPTKKATTEILEDMNFIKTDPDLKGVMPNVHSTPTVKEMIKDLGQGKIPKDSIVLIDEAGLMGSKEMASLLENADKSGVRLFMMGDNLQIPPKMAGNGLDLMLQNKNEIGLDNFELSVVLRQKRENEAGWTLDIRYANALKALNGYVNRHYADLDTRDNPDMPYIPELQGASGNGDAGLTALEDKKAVYQELTDDFIRFRTNNPKASYVIMGTDEQSAQDLNAFMREEMKKQGIIENVQTYEFEGKKMEIGKGDTLMLSNPVPMDIAFSIPAGTELKVAQVKDESLVLMAGKRMYNLPAETVVKNSEYGLVLSLHQAQGQSKDRAFLAVDKTGCMDLVYGGVAFSRHQNQMSAYVSKQAYPTMESLADEMKVFRTRQKLLSDSKGIEIIKEKPVDFKQSMQDSLKKNTVDAKMMNLLKIQGGRNG